MFCQYDSAVAMAVGFSINPSQAVLSACGGDGVLKLAAQKLEEQKANARSPGSRS